MRVVLCVCVCVCVCHDTGLLDNGLRFRPMTLPDRFIEHGDYKDQLAEAGLTAGHIAGTALQVRRVCVFVCVRARARVCL